MTFHTLVGALTTEIQGPWWRARSRAFTKLIYVKEVLLTAGAR